MNFDVDLQISPVLMDVVMGLSYNFDVQLTGITPETILPKAILNDNSWAMIKIVSDAGTGASYWSIGDCKQITINGTFGDTTFNNYSTWVYILGFNHNSDVEGTGIAFQGFKTAQIGGVDICLVDTHYGLQSLAGFNLNTSGTSHGGWNNSYMRTTTLPAFKNALPSDLQGVIKTTTLYSDNVGDGTYSANAVTETQDECYLLAEWEVFGSRVYANLAERNHQAQYDYYANGNSKIKYRHDDTGVPVIWWGRSCVAGVASAFCSVNINGSSGAYSANTSLGLAVVFKV